MHKGECFITKDDSIIYRLVGRWGKALVLSSSGSTPVFNSSAGRASSVGM